MRIVSPAPTFFDGPWFYVMDKAAKEEKQVGSRRDGDRTAGADKSAETLKEDKEEVMS